METEKSIETGSTAVRHHHALEHILLDPIQPPSEARSMPKERANTGKEEAENERDLDRLGADFRDTLSPYSVQNAAKSADFDKTAQADEFHIAPLFAESGYFSDHSSSSTSASEGLEPANLGFQQLMSADEPISFTFAAQFIEEMETVPAPPAHPSSLPTAKKWIDTQSMQKPPASGTMLPEESGSIDTTDYGIDVWESGALDSLHSIANMSTVASTVRQLKVELEESIQTARSQRLLRDRTALLRTEYDQLAIEMQEELEIARSTIDDMVAKVVSMEHELAASRRRWADVVEKSHSLKRKFTLQENLLNSALLKASQLSVEITSSEARLQRLQGSFAQEINLNTREMAEDAAMMRAIRNERRLVPASKIASSQAHTAPTAPPKDDPSAMAGLSSSSASQATTMIPNTPPPLPPRSYKQKFPSFIKTTSPTNTSNSAWTI